MRYMRTFSKSIWSSKQRGSSVLQRFYGIRERGSRNDGWIFWECQHYNSQLIYERTGTPSLSGASPGTGLLARGSVTLPGFRSVASAYS